MKHAFLAAMLLAAAARAEVLHVPGDFASIQAAVDAALTGDEIVVAAGTYEETVTLLLKTGITLRGQGKVVLHGGDIDTAVLSVVACTDVRVERLRFEQPLFAAIEVSEGDHVTLSRCRVEDSAKFGLRVRESLATALERCQVLRSAGDGVDVTETQGTLVYRCRVEDGAESAIVVTLSEAARIERCTVIEPEGVGLEIADAGNCSALRNVLVRPGLGGITINGVQVTVRDNKLIEPSAVGVSIGSGGAGAVIEDNRVVKTDGTGIDVDGDAAVVRRNRIVKPGQFGILVFADAPTLTDNVIIHPGEAGFALESGLTQGTAGHNRILQPGGSGCVVAGTGLLVHDNLVVGAGAFGFFLIQGPNTIIHNEAKGSDQFDLNDSSGVANVYVDNTFTTIAPPP